MSLQVRVQALIERFGDPSQVTVTQATASAYTRADGAVTNVSPSSFQIVGVHVNAQVTIVEGTVRQRTDEFILIAGLLANGSAVPFVPRPSDKVAIGGVTFTVIGPTTILRHRGDVVAYKIHGRAS